MLHRQPTEETEAWGSMDSFWSLMSVDCCVTFFVGRCFAQKQPGQIEPSGPKHNDVAWAAQNARRTTSKRSDSHRPPCGRRSLSSVYTSLPQVRGAGEPRERREPLRSLAVTAHPVPLPLPLLGQICGSLTNRSSNEMGSFVDSLASTRP